jgi:hypothetical protein
MVERNEQHTVLHVYYLTVCTATIQGVFGAALLEDAKRCADRVAEQTGLPAHVVEYTGERPRVGARCPVRACDILYTAAHPRKPQ